MRNGETIIDRGSTELFAEELAAAKADYRKSGSQRDARRIETFERVLRDIKAKETR
jgi:hypothetical protein